MSRLLRIAVTGHRLNQLPEPSRPLLRSQISDCLRQVCLTVAGGETITPVLISALAEGADRYAADAALALGWRLESPLPFLVERYEKDFEDAQSIAEFRRYLQASAKVTPIDGEALVAAGKGGAAPYAAVGEALLRGAHVVLAVWNGAPKRGPGGTAEVVENALAQGTAVIWLHPDARGPRLLAPSRKARKDSLRRLVSERLPASFQAIAFPSAAAA